MVIGGVHFRIFALTNLNSSSYQNAQTVYSDCDLLGSLVRNGCEESPGEIYFKPVTKTNANFITAISNITNFSKARSLRYRFLCPSVCFNSYQLVGRLLLVGALVHCYNSLSYNRCYNAYSWHVHMFAQGKLKRLSLVTGFLSQDRKLAPVSHCEMCNIVLGVRKLFPIILYNYRGFQQPQCESKCCEQQIVEESVEVSAAELASFLGRPTAFILCFTTTDRPRTESCW